VVVERGEEHPALYFDELWANEISWVSENFSLSLPLKCRAKIRYRQGDQQCTIKSIKNGELHVEFTSPQRAVALRQSIVFYIDMEGEEVCLGGAMISRAGKSHYEQSKTD
jgi:tRNA-specific 2-thiouridylase